MLLILVIHIVIASRLCRDSKWKYFVEIGIDSDEKSHRTRKRVCVRACGAVNQQMTGDQVWTMESMREKAN